MTHSQISLLLLAIQILLLVGTAFLGPLLLRPSGVNFIIYSLIVLTLWVTYAVAALFFNSGVGRDVPGAGYLIIGFVGWIVGSTIYLLRFIRRRK
jgi:hypothetical protein